MTNKLLFLLPLFLLLAGCSSTGQLDSTAAQPELISMTTLPQLESLSPNDGLKLKVLFHIRGDGIVTDVKILGSGADPGWDNAAIDSMKQWRFSALPGDPSPKDRWIRSTIIVQVQEPAVLNVGEIHANSQQEADSLFALLEGGADFEVMSRQVRPGTMISLGKLPVPVDIAMYPQRIRQELRKLAVDGFTHPIKVGAEFVIYKRFNADQPHKLQP